MGLLYRGRRKDPADGLPDPEILGGVTLPGSVARELVVVVHRQVTSRILRARCRRRSPSCVGVSRSRPGSIVDSTVSRIGTTPAALVATNRHCAPDARRFAETFRFKVTPVA